MERWDGKVAVVTGASSGIGASIATALAKRGMAVVGMARRVELVEEVAKGLPPGCKGKVHPLKVDVTAEGEVVEAFQWVHKHLGPPHVLVNNAGYAPFGYISKAKREDYRKIRACFETNVLGVLVCTGEAIRLMKEAGVEDGHIVNINSISGHYIMSQPGLYAYSASKHALTVISEGLRRELVNDQSKIRVTDIGPGLVNTNIGVTGEFPHCEKLITMVPTLESDDVARSVIHALSAPPNVQIAELIIRAVGEVF